MPYHRMLAINAAAAGPYKLVGKCFDCGSEQPIVNFPRPFATSIAICRRCRETRTGIPDKRNMIQATATVSEPAKLEDGWKTHPEYSAADFTIEDA